MADRLVGIYIDEFHLKDDSAWATARDAVADFLRTSLAGPRDLVLVLAASTPGVDACCLRIATRPRTPSSRLIRARATTRRDRVSNATSSLAIRRVSMWQRNQIAPSAISAMGATSGRCPSGRKTLIADQQRHRVHCAVAARRQRERARRQWSRGEHGARRDLRASPDAAAARLDDSGAA